MTQDSARTSISVTALHGIPEIAAGQQLAPIIAEAARETGLGLLAGDIVVAAQKIVSKAEGRLVRLDTVSPGEDALRLAAETGKDPRLVELVLRESQSVLRAAPGVLIVRHRLGLVMANAGIDQSNVPGGDDHALLLPLDPDRSARVLADELSAQAGGAVAVLISDSFGRAWRIGTCAVAIGCAGLAPVRDQRGETDRFGRVLKVTQPALADQLAAAAALVMGEASEGLPVAVIRGFALAGNGVAMDMVRAPADDLFG